MRFFFSPPLTVPSHSAMPKTAHPIKQVPAMKIKAKWDGKGRPTEKRQLAALAKNITSGANCGTAEHWDFAISA
jgi:hypothetical protein